MPDATLIAAIDIDAFWVAFAQYVLPPVVGELHCGTARPASMAPISVMLPSIVGRLHRARRTLLAFSQSGKCSR